LKEYDAGERRNYQYVVVEVDETKAALNRDELVAVLQAENVLARKYFWPGCHRMEPYKSFFPNAHLLLPHTERLAARIMVLPTGQAVGVEDVEKVCAIIRAALGSASEVRIALEKMTATARQLIS
jgi:dTDP-4-amino-4,6-dideoxygalactose transaminase